MIGREDLQLGNLKENVGYMEMDVLSMEEKKKANIILCFQRNMIKYKE